MIDTTTKPYGVGRQGPRCHLERFNLLLLLRGFAFVNDINHNILAFVGLFLDRQWFLVARL